MTVRTILVTGGARSGKSAWALAEASKKAGPKAFIATAESRDDEMKDRIARHQAERGSDWETIEAPVDLVGPLHRTREGYGAVIVDCLTLWTANVMHVTSDPEEIFQDFVANLVAQRSSELYLVTNEVGMGIVPENALARRFRDVAGRLNQQVAAVADGVVLTVAGVPVWIKGKQE